MGSIPVANPSPRRTFRFSRRGALLTVAVLTCVSSLLVVIAFAWPKIPDQPRYDWVSLARIEDLPVNEPVAFKDHRLYLARLETGEVLALSRKSTHLGCPVPWRPDFEFLDRKGWFRDPCSGATWAVDGSIVFGPAPRDMDRYPLAVVDGEVIVDVLNRLCAPGAQSTTHSPCLPSDQYHGTPPLRP